MAIAAGDNHSLALCSDGTVVAWGANSQGELGNGTTTSTNAPVAVSTNSGVSALHGKTVVAIAAGGANFSVALCSDGTVALWGDNRFGQLGDNTTTQRLTPVAVNTNLGVSALYGKTVVAIAAGDSHSLALCSDGTIAAWGNNPTGQLGDNTTTQRNAPVAVNTTPLATNQRFTGVCSGPFAYHTLALVAAPPASQVSLAAAADATNGYFQFAFTNTPGAFFGVLAATNPVLPLSDWTCLTGLTSLSVMPVVDAACSRGRVGCGVTSLNVALGEVSVMPGTNGPATAGWTRPELTHAPCGMWVRRHSPDDREMRPAVLAKAV